MTKKFPASPWSLEIKYLTSNKAISTLKLESAGKKYVKKCTGEKVKFSLTMDYLLGEKKLRNTIHDVSVKLT